MCVQMCLFSVFRLERQGDRRFRDIAWEIKIWGKIVESQKTKDTCPIKGQGQGKCVD